MANMPGRFRRFLDRLRGVPIEYDLTSYREVVSAVNERRLQLEEAPAKVVEERFSALREGSDSGAEPPAAQLCEAFALICEAARRAVGLRPFDVQVIAGLGLQRGRIVELQTGEGKTLAAVLPACLSALRGEGVHVLTFNDYLARRDAAWMGPIYRSLGLTVAAVQEGSSPAARRAAYGSDVTYAAAKQVGFDFLRASLRWSDEEQVLRPFSLAIVDEADSILIDEARNPLLIAGSFEGPRRNPRQLARIACQLAADHYSFEPHARSVYLTEAGYERAEQELGLAAGALHQVENLPLLTELHLALHAAVLLHRDRDYIVRRGRIEHVDELTGRVVDDRRWPDGLQAALEAKEGLRTEPDGRVLSSLTLQHFMQLYPKLSGMTATARRGAEELYETYGTPVLVVPSNRPCIRTDHPDVIYSTRRAKLAALVQEITRVHAGGRPVLVGTASVAESEQLAAALSERGLSCEVLNARTDEREAQIIAEAGAPGAVTVSTNMAGRGTDIKLGGRDERRRDEVIAQGGLYVIGTNRHESRRIDEQLRGRAGRQGDPGDSRFIISLEDELLARYGLAEALPRSFRPAHPDKPIESPVVGRAIARVQRQIEGQSHDIRATLRQYSAVVEQQRCIVAQRREAVLAGDGGPSLLAAAAPGRYAELLALWGEGRLQQIEGHLTLAHLDRGWSDYLEQLKDIQDAAQLVGVAAERPLDQFCQRAAAAFDEMLQRVDEEIVASFEQAPLTAEGMDLEGEGLCRPSSTWTYLVNDRLFGEYRDLVLGNVAFAAGAALATGPLIFVLGALERLKLRRGRHGRG